MSLIEDHRTNFCIDLWATRKQVVSPHFRRNIRILCIVTKNSNTLTLGEFSYRQKEYFSYLQGHIGTYYDTFKHKQRLKKTTDCSLQERPVHQFIGNTRIVIGHNVEICSSLNIRQKRTMSKDENQNRKESGVNCLVWFIESLAAQDQQWSKGPTYLPGLHRTQFKQTSIFSEC